MSELGELVLSEGEGPAGGADAVDERVQCEGFHGEVAAAFLDGPDDGALHGLHGVHEAAPVLWYCRAREGACAVSVHDARHLDHSVLREEIDLGAVGDVQHELCGLVVGDGVHDREGDAIVAPGFEVGLVTVHSAGRVSVGGHVGLLSTATHGVP